MWFDPVTIVKTKSPPTATLATLATFPRGKTDSSPFATLATNGAVHPSKVAEVAKVATAQELKNDHQADLEALAANIGLEFHIPTDAVLGLLDDEDRADIAAGDEAMLEAWKTAVYSLLYRGEWAALPRLAPASAELVRCCDCGHAKPTDHPVLIDCAAEVKSGAPVGPYRWWGTDSHICGAWGAKL